MRNFTPNEYNAFKQIAGMNQSTLKKSLKSLLKKTGYDPVETEDYIWAKGEIPIALVAHLDTVFKFPPKEFYYDKTANVIWSPDGLGADDRAGVYGILQILRSGLRPHIIFTTDEEKGGVGAYALAEAGCPFEDLRYMIELDRQGSVDCVFYDCYNVDFINYVENFGFIEDYGTFSDISMICPIWRIAGVNLSIGYKNEHTYGEIFNVGHFLSTIDKVKKMLNEENIPYFKYIPIARRESFWNRLGYSTASTETEDMGCALCGLPFFKEELFPVQMTDGSLEYFCPDCVGHIALWCHSCNEPYENDGKSPQLCPDCRKEYGIS